MATAGVKGLTGRQNYCQWS